MTHEEAMQACPLFAGLSPEDRRYALQYFSAREAVYRRGDFLNRIGDPLRSFGLVLEGTIQVYMDDYDGRHMIMANVGPGDTYGESLCYLGLEAPIYICAVTDAAVLQLSADRLHGRDVCSDARNTLLSGRFTAMLARRTLAMNDRIQILSKTGIRARLVTFFSQYVRTFGRSFSVPFDRSNMATYLGTDRSALSRELSRMQRDGLIRFSKNRFEVLGPIGEP